MLCISVEEFLFWKKKQLSKGGDLQSFEVLLDCIGGISTSDLNLKILNPKSYLNLKKNEQKIRSLVKFNKNAIRKYEKNLKNISDNRLFYIPFGIKDIFNVKNYSNEKGSVIYKNFNPGNNARVVDRLLQCGAIPFGKTVTSEFAVHELNKTKNPYNLKRTPGTSSSGSAASVACDSESYVRVDLWLKIWSVAKQARKHSHTIYHLCMVAERLA